MKSKTQHPQGAYFDSRMDHLRMFALAGRSDTRLAVECKGPRWVQIVIVGQFDNCAAAEWVVGNKHSIVLGCTLLET